EPVVAHVRSRMAAQAVIDKSARAALQRDIVRHVDGCFVQRKAASGGLNTRHQPETHHQGKKNFFHCHDSGSVRYKIHAIGYRLGLTQSAPPRHEQEEAKVKERPDLRHTLAEREW